MQTFRKYQNRRLYCAEKSRYVTLADLERLVLAAEPIQVIDNVDDSDVTSEVLLNILREKELRAPTLGVTRLTALIRGESR